LAILDFYTAQWPDFIVYLRNRSTLWWWWWWWKSHWTYCNFRKKLELN